MPKETNNLAAIDLEISEPTLRQSKIVFFRERDIQHGRAGYTFLVKSIKTHW